MRTTTADEIDGGKRFVDEDTRLPCLTYDNGPGAAFKNERETVGLSRLVVRGLVALNLITKPWQQAAANRVPTTRTTNESEKPDSKRPTNEQRSSVDYIRLLFLPRFTSTLLVECSIALVLCRMDLLKKELERKKRALQQALQQQQQEQQPSSSQPEPTAKEGAILSYQPTTKKRRYVKAGELRRLQEEQERQKWEERQRKQQQEQQRNDSAVTKTTTKEEEQQQRQGQPVPAASSAVRNNRTKDSVPHACAQRDQQMKPTENETTTNATTTATTTKVSSSHNSRPLARLSAEEVTKRLRSLGLPVRLFGERTVRQNNYTTTDRNSNNPSTVAMDDDVVDDTARKLRLQAALANEQQARDTLSEREDFRLEQGHSIRNRFLDRHHDEKQQGEEGVMVVAQPKKATTPFQANCLAQQPQAEGTDTTSKHSTSTTPSSSNAASAKSASGDMAAASVLTTDDHDPHRRIYLYFKSLLKSWEDDLLRRPDEVKRSVAGRNETKTHQQCKDYIRPLFKLCKTRQLEANLTTQLVKIVDECQRGEFVAAHDAYMDVAIGRAAWPIGVTMVGIHARTGRAKIESQNVAHVMNSELQRKYLTSVKRLMSYAQKQATHVDPSKKVLS